MNKLPANAPWRPGAQTVTQPPAAASSCTSPSISTGMSKGSAAMPTALRACAPRSAPKTSTMRSVKPLMTAGWRLNPGGAVDHAEDPHPGADALEAAELALQAAEDRQSREPGGLIGLLGRDFGAHPTQRRRQRAVGPRRTMTGEDCPCTDDAHPGKGQMGRRR